MKNLLNRIKFLFTKAVFDGENTRMEFFLYHLLVGSFFIVPASIYLKLENTPADFVNTLYLPLSFVSIFIGIYLLSINTIRRGNKTIQPFWGSIGVFMLITGQFFAYPFTALYQLVAIILLLLPNHK